MAYHWHKKFKRRIGTSLGVQRPLRIFTILGASSDLYSMFSVIRRAIVHLILTMMEYLNPIWVDIGSLPRMQIVGPGGMVIIMRRACIGTHHKSVRGVVTMVGQSSRLRTVPFIYRIPITYPMIYTLTMEHRRTTSEMEPGASMVRTGTSGGARALITMHQ